MQKYKKNPPKKLLNFGFDSAVPKSNVGKKKYFFNAVKANNKSPLLYCQIWLTLPRGHWGWIV